MEKYRHNKTGNEYHKLYDAIDCTNSRDGVKVVVYVNKDLQVFVREASEFYQKFTRI